MERTNSGENEPAPPGPAAPPTGLESGVPPRAPDKRELLVRLAAGLAHEIKNPLSTMASNLALMEEDLGKNRSSDAPQLSAREKRIDKRVRTLQREIQRLATIVEDFLRYARGVSLLAAATCRCWVDTHRRRRRACRSRSRPTPAARRRSTARRVTIAAAARPPG